MMTQQDSDTAYFEQWLHRGTPNPAYVGFQHNPLIEIAENRASVFEDLAQRVFIYHNDPKTYSADLEALGFGESAAVLDKRPRSHRTRMGNFGEIVASEYLSVVEGYRIPVFRLRYNPNPDSSMKGDDVLAFKFGDEQGRGREILVVEAKAYQDFNTDVVEEAFDQLKKGQRPRAKSIVFVLQVLADQQREQERSQVLNMLDRFNGSRPIKRHYLFLATGNRPRDPFRCVHDAAEKPENLCAINLHVADIAKFVNSLFDYEVPSSGTTTG